MQDVYTEPILNRFTLPIFRRRERLVRSNSSGLAALLRRASDAMLPAVNIVGNQTIHILGEGINGSSVAGGYAMIR